MKEPSAVPCHWTQKWARVSTVFALLILLVSCASPEDQPATTTSETAAAGIDSVTVATIDVRRAEGISVFDDSVWIGSEIEFGATPEENGISRIDPTTNEVTTVVPRTDSSFSCDGTSVGTDGLLWACSGGNVIGVDPDSGEVALEVEFEGSSDQFFVGTDEEGLWLAASDGLSVVHLGYDGSELGRVDLPSVCWDNAVLDGIVYLTCSDTGELVAIDPAAGTAAVAVSGLVSPSTIGLGHGVVWFSSNVPGAGVSWYDPETEESGQVANTPDVSLGCIAEASESMWAWGSGDQLVEIDPTTRMVVSSLGATRPNSSGCVAEGFGSLWITSVNFGQVTRLTPP